MISVCPSACAWVFQERLEETGEGPTPGDITARKESESGRNHTHTDTESIVAGATEEDNYIMTLPPKLGLRLSNLKAPARMVW